jgi:predicted Zn-ribbon and HTH transcriptional regulator
MENRTQCTTPLYHFPLKSYYNNLVTTLVMRKLMKCLKADCGHMWFTRKIEVEKCPRCQGKQVEEMKLRTASK